MVHDARRWIMIFKDEGKTLLQKPFSRDWVEGPPAIKIGADRWIPAM